MPKGRKPVIDSATEQDWLSAYQGGMTVPGIAAKWGEPQHRVRRALARNRVQLEHKAPSGPKSRVDAEGWQDMIRRYQSGREPIRETAKAYGISSAYMLKEFHRRGVSMRGDTLRVGPKPGSSNPDFSGANHPAWKGGRYIDPKGYVRVKMPHDHPFRQAMAQVNGYVREHRLVMAELLGRPLLAHENLHHINGDRQDNRPENLQLMSKAQPSGVRARCAECGSRHIVFDEIGAED